MYEYATLDSYKTSAPSMYYYTITGFGVPRPRHQIFIVCLVSILYSVGCWLLVAMNFFVESNSCTILL
jgi:hypothetical protein